MQSKTISHFLASSLIAVVALSISATAGPHYKLDNSNDLNLLTSWSTTSGAQTPNPVAFDPTDVWYFNDATMLGSKTLSLGADITIAGIGLDNTTTANPGNTYNVVINSGNTLTLNGGTISGTGVSGGSGYTAAGIVLNRGVGGTLTIGADLVIGAAQQWVTSRALTVAGGVNLGANTLSLNTAGTSNVMTLSGVISGTGAMNKTAGTGALVLTNTANSFGGQVTLVGGTTQVTKLATIGNNSSLGTGSGASSLVLNGATLTFTGSTIDTTDRAIDMRAGVAINNTGSGTTSFTAANVIQGGTASARTMTLGGSNTTDNTFGSALSDSGTSPNITRLQKSGLGKWIVTGVHTYTGATPINQGTLAVTGSGVLGGATGSSADEGNIWFTSTNSNAALQFETTANLGAADQIRFRNTGGTAGQGGALVYTGTTDQVLSKTIQCDSSIGIRLESNSVGGKLTFNGAFSQTNRSLYLGGTGTGNNTLVTAFTGSGGITKRDAGTWVLTGTNTYTGATTLTGGTLALGSSNVLGNSTAVSIGAATLAVGAGVSDTVGTLDSTAAATINVGSGATLAFAASNAIDWTDGTLNITGTFVSGSSLRFGDDATQPGLTAGQLAKISAVGFTGFALDANGYLTATASSGFSAWAATNAPGQTIDQDHDNDGVSNGVEYFMGFSGSGFTANPAPDATTHVISWPKGGSYTGIYSVDYRVQISTNLQDWSNVPVENVTIDGDSVDYDLGTAPAGTTKFARLIVTGP